MILKLFGIILILITGRLFAEKALAVLSKNPNALVLVEGIQIYPKDINTNRDFTSKNPHDYHNTWWGGKFVVLRIFLLN